MSDIDKCPHCGSAVLICICAACGRIRDDQGVVLADLRRQLAQEREGREKADARADRLLVLSAELTEEVSGLKVALAAEHDTRAEAQAACAAMRDGVLEVLYDSGVDPDSVENLPEYVKAALAAKGAEENRRLRALVDMVFKAEAAKDTK